MLAFNSKDSDGFDKPPIDLGTSILNAMTRVDFAAVEEITAANTLALKSQIDMNLAESLIKTAVEDSKTETGNDLANPEYQQLVECAKNSLKLLREVAS